jgi:hypothetical protein
MPITEKRPLPSNGELSIGAVEIDDGAPLLFDIPAAIQKKGRLPDTDLN